VVGKSTVPVGTARRVLDSLHAAAPAGSMVDLAWNPSSCGGFAVQDSLAPDRIVLGVTSDGAEARLREIYRAPLEAGSPLLVMDLETAELVKVRRTRSWPPRSPSSTPWPRSARSQVPT